MMKTIGRKGYAIVSGLRYEMRLTFLTDQMQLDVRVLLLLIRALSLFFHC